MGKLGLILMGGALFSKSLIQYSVDGWGCVPSLFFDLRPNNGGVSEDNEELLASHACTATLSVPDPVAGHLQHTPLPETPGHSQASLAQCLVGSLFLYPESRCAQSFVYALQELIFVTRVYVPWFFVSSQQRFGAMDIKALGVSQLSGLG